MKEGKVDDYVWFVFSCVWEEECKGLLKLFVFVLFGFKVFSFGYYLMEIKNGFLEEVREIFVFCVEVMSLIWCSVILVMGKIYGIVSGVGV